MAILERIKNHFNESIQTKITAMEILSPAIAEAGELMASRLVTVCLLGSTLVSKNMPSECRFVSSRFHRCYLAYIIGVDINSFRLFYAGVLLPMIRVMSNHAPRAIKLFSNNNSY